MDALHSRIYQYPTSAIKQNDRKINYRDFLMSAEYEGCIEAVKRIVPRIDMDKIGAFIDDSAVSVRTAKKVLQVLYKGEVRSDPCAGT